MLGTKKFRATNLVQKAEMERKPPAQIYEASDGVSWVLRQLRPVSFKPAPKKLSCSLCEAITRVLAFQVQEGA